MISVVYVFCKPLSVETIQQLNLCRFHVDNHFCTAIVSVSDGKAHRFKCHRDLPLFKFSYISAHIKVAPTSKHMATNATLFLNYQFYRWKLGVEINIDVKLKE